MVEINRPIFVKNLIAGFLVGASYCLFANVAKADPVDFNSDRASQFDFGPLKFESFNDATNPAGSSGNSRSGSDGGGSAPGSSGATGVTSSPPSRPYTAARSNRTGNQSVARTATQTCPLDRVFGGGKALPPTRLDSFVKNSGAMADLIYGDEGATNIPPYFGFDESHRLERGVHSGGLTTGHKSGLPDAWGWPQ